ncbi:MAG: potassium channel family protein [Solirubrobacterales bacterium]
MTWFRMLRTMVRGVKEDPEFRALAGAVGSLLVVGTVFYALNQDWSLVDSFYFSVTTLTTVGFGISPPRETGQSSPPSPTNSPGSGCWSSS